jgi:putative Mg2+ transporter-C (MgtC) family protein
LTRAGVGVDEVTIAMRLSVAAALSGVLGLEREWRRQPAGFRTHILVATGACLFTLTGLYGFRALDGGGAEVSVDTARVASQVVVGIGFLGGGAILKYKTSVRGLTTAANLWIAAAVGVAVGGGMIVAAAVTVALALLTLTGLRVVERRFFPGNPDEEVTSGDE